jgi:hypothetical protein
MPKVRARARVGEKGYSQARASKGKGKAQKVLNHIRIPSDSHIMAARA